MNIKRLENGSFQATSNKIVIGIAATYEEALKLGLENKFKGECAMINNLKIKYLWSEAGLREENTMLKGKAATEFLKSLIYADARYSYNKNGYYKTKIEIEYKEYKDTLRIDLGDGDLKNMMYWWQVLEHLMTRYREHVLEHSDKKIFEMYNIEEVKAELQTIKGYIEELKDSI